MEETSLTLHQIELMKHAVGLEPSNVKNGKYEAYRNYYAAAGNNPDWAYLVSQKLAVSRRDPFCPKDTVYHLTAKGMDTLSEIVGVTITNQR